MKYCNRPFSHIHMLPEGSIWPCSWMHYEIGNIIKQDLPEIWNSPAAQEVRESIFDGSFRYCRKESCPFLENDSLPDLEGDALHHATMSTEVPVTFNAAFDYTCNHSCPSCREHIFKPNETYTKNIDTTINNILPYLNKGISLSTNGNGDVFSNRQMMDMLARLHPENPDFELNIETNGVLFDEAHWSKISHLKSFKISVVITPNSFERDTFKYLSGGHDNLDKLLKNLRFVQSLRKSGDINFYAVSIVTQDRNFRELPAFTRQCLENFNVDQVIVKPLYQWFGMKEDIYWFKNVRNPLHPYHSEYLEMMKDSIFDDSRVFFWGGREHLTDSKLHPAYQYKTNQDILLRLLNIDAPGEKLRTELENAGCHAVAVCSPTDETGLLLAKLLVKAGMPPKCFLQRFTPNKAPQNGLNTFGFPEMDFTSVDTILVTDHYHYDKLEEDIRNHKFSGKILSFEALVQKIGGGDQ